MPGWNELRAAMAAQGLPAIGRPMQRQVTLSTSSAPAHTQAKARAAGQ